MLLAPDGGGMRHAAMVTGYRGGFSNDKAAWQRSPLEVVLFHEICSDMVFICAEPCQGGESNSMAKLYLAQLQRGEQKRVLGSHIDAT